MTTLKQITSQSFSHIGRVSDHVHPPAGIAAAISSATARACAIFPRCRGRHNRAVSPYFRHRSMLIAAFDDRRPPDGHSPVLGRRLDPCGTTWRPLRIYSGRKVIGSSCVGRGRRPHRRQRSHADREAGRVLAQPGRKECGKPGTRPVTLLRRCARRGVTEASARTAGHRAIR